MDSAKSNGKREHKKPALIRFPKWLFRTAEPNSTCQHLQRYQEQLAALTTTYEKSLTSHRKKLTDLFDDVSKSVVLSSSTPQSVMDIYHHVVYLRLKENELHTQLDCHCIKLLHLRSQECTGLIEVLECAEDGISVDIDPSFWNKPEFLVHSNVEYKTLAQKIALINSSIANGKDIYNREIKEYRTQVDCLTRADALLLLLEKLQVVRGHHRLRRNGLQKSEANAILQRIGFLICDTSTAVGRIFSKWVEKIKYDCRFCMKSQDFNMVQLYKKELYVCDGEISFSPILCMLPSTQIIHYFISCFKKILKYEFKVQIFNVTNDILFGSVIHSLIFAQIRGLAFSIDWEETRCRDVHWQHSSKTVRNFSPQQIGINNKYTETGYSNKSCGVSLRFSSASTIKSHCDKFLYHSIEATSLISLETTPLGIIDGIMNMIKTLHAETMEICEIDFAHLNADMLVTLLVYVLSRADIPYINRRLKVTEWYVFNCEETGEIGCYMSIQIFAILLGLTHDCIAYYLTCMKAAVSYIEYFGFRNSVVSQKNILIDMNSNSILSACEICGYCRNQNTKETEKNNLRIQNPSLSNHMSELSDWIHDQITLEDMVNATSSEGWIL